MTLHAYPLTVLFWPGLLIFFSTLSAALYVTRAPIPSILAAALKAGFFLAYFGYFFDGSFTFLDDITYLREAAFFSYNGITIGNLFKHLTLVIATSGNHIFYPLFCTYALYIFGPGYFAPVALNTTATVAIALLGSKLAKVEFGLEGSWHTVTFFALLFDPTIVAWSGIFNGKDTLVLLGHLIFLYGFMLIYRGRPWQAVMIMAPTGVILFFTRFYVPLLFLVIFLLSSLLGAGKRWRWRILFSGLVGVGGLLAAIGPSSLSMIIGLVRDDFVNPVYGVVRFLLTPIPFNTEPDYRFLEIPSVFNWILMPIQLWGAVICMRMRTSFSKLFIVYCAVFVGLYSTYGQLEGPRQRLQLEYAVVIFTLLSLRALAAWLADPISPAGIATQRDI